MLQRKKINTKNLLKNFFNTLKVQSNFKVLAYIDERERKSESIGLKIDRNELIMYKTKKNEKPIANRRFGSINADTEIPSRRTSDCRNI